jgi:uncharacterized protein (DUF58 family)
VAIPKRPDIGDLSGHEALPGAKALAANLPDLLVEAKRVASTVAIGGHGRGRPGPGETFWQFRPFELGEPSHRIDWRRSAREDHSLYVREREWEAAHTIYLWADRSASMRFRSRLAHVSKYDRAMTLMLAVADLLGRGGERIGLIDGPPPTASRESAEKLANTLMTIPRSNDLPMVDHVRRFSDVVLIADFLDPIAGLMDWMARLSTRGANVHLVQVLDPAEESFPFGGRTRFLDPESGLALIVGKAQAWREGYRDRLAAQKASLADTARRYGWRYQLHHTDRPATEPLLFLRAALGGDGPAGIAA